MKYIISIDQGTTGTTIALIDSESFDLVYKTNNEFKQIYPEPGLVEHNLDDIWNSVIKGIEDVTEKYQLTKENILTIGITNQRETTCAFRKNGEPLYHAIVWQDRRTTPFCISIKKRNLEKEITEKTGLVMDPYFSGSKINWLINNSIKVQNASKENNLCFGTIDTYLLYRLTNCKSYYTDTTNASRTLLMNLETRQWDDSLCDLFQVSKKELPEIKDSIDNFGVTEGLEFLPDGIPITGILGDQQSALFGQAGINQGDVKCTYGTGAFALVNTGTEIKKSSNGLLSTVAYSHNGKVFYALEGSSYIAGAAVQWLRDNLSFFKDAPEIEKLASNIKNINEVKNLHFFPYFSGIGTPFWKPDAKACLIGMSRDTSKEHISRACLEGISLSIDDLFNSLKSDSSVDFSSIKVDGGAVANDLLCEIQASFSNTDIIRPKVIETTAYGAALAAAIGVGHISFENLASLWKSDQVFAKQNNEYYKLKKTDWKNYQKAIYLND
jgi:glycerol kinase